MGDKTKIQWCNHTFNPWMGCTKVSEGCKNCYAENWAQTQGKGVGIEWNNIPTLRKDWKPPKKWNKQNAGRDRAPVFCASLADVFDENVPSEWRQRLWDLIRETPNLAWLLLTKRPQNVTSMLPSDLASADHIWVGCSVETQKRADERLPIMQSLPVKNKFLSVEPLLEFVSLDLQGINWVIVGGESGLEARRFDLEWAIALGEQCRKAQTPFFFKQAGSNPYWQGKHLKLNDKSGGDLSELPRECNIREFPEFGKEAVKREQLSLL